MKYYNFTNNSLITGLKREIDDFKNFNNIQGFKEIDNLINLLKNNHKKCFKYFFDFYKEIEHNIDYLTFVKKKLKIKRNYAYLLWIKRMCLLFFVFLLVSNNITDEDDKINLNIAIFGSKRPTSDIDLSIIYLGNNKNYIGIYNIINNIEDLFIQYFKNTQLFDVEIYAGLLSISVDNNEHLIIDDINHYIEITENEYLNHFLPYIFIAFIRNIHKINNKINNNIHFYIKLLNKYLINIKNFILNDIEKLHINKNNISMKNTKTERNKSVKKYNFNIFNKLSNTIKHLFTNYKKCKKNINIVNHFDKMENFDNVNENNLYLINIINSIINKLKNFDFINNEIYINYVDSFYDYNIKRNFYYKYVKETEIIIVDIRNIILNKNYPDNINKNKNVFLKYIKYSCIADIFRDENYVFPFSVTSIVRNNYFYGSNNIIFELFFIIIEQYGFLHRFNRVLKKKYKYNSRIEFIKKEIYIIRDLLSFKNYLKHNNFCDDNIYNYPKIKNMIDAEFKRFYK